MEKRKVPGGGGGGKQDPNPSPSTSSNAGSELARSEEDEYERLKALATDKYKEKNYVEAIKYYNDAAKVVYSKSDQ